MNFIAIGCYEEEPHKQEESFEMITKGDPSEGGIVVIHTATTLAALAQRSDDIRVHACFQYLV